jgi:hypothetical protein
LHHTKDNNDRLCRWFLKLAHDGYDYNVVHRPRKEHANADALSRLMCTWNKANNDIVYWMDEEPIIPNLLIVHPKIKSNRKIPAQICSKAVKLKQY